MNIWTLFDNVLMVSIKFLILYSIGTIPTDATFIREYMMNHKDYKQDSIITNEMAYDFLKVIDQVYSFRSKVYTQINSGFHHGYTHLPDYVKIPHLYPYDSSDSSDLSNDEEDEAKSPSVSPKYGPKLVGYFDRGSVDCARMYKKLRCAREMYKSQSILKPCSCLNQIHSQLFHLNSCFVLKPKTKNSQS